MSFWYRKSVCRKLRVSSQLQLSSRAPRSLDLLFFFGAFNMGVNGDYKNCHIMETAGRRGKRNKIWDSGTLVTHMWCTFEPSSVQGHLRSFGACVSKWPVTPKWLVIEQNGVKFETRGQLLCNIGWFDSVGFKVHLGSFGALVSKWPVSRKGLFVERNGPKLGITNTSYTCIG